MGISVNFVHLCVPDRKGGPTGFRLLMRKVMGWSMDIELTLVQQQELIDGRELRQA